MRRKRKVASTGGLVMLRSRTRVSDDLIPAISVRSTHIHAE
ncbi:hypothetical protein HMPREF9418_2502 [Neisseria macacae ATCC 33926]|uniref:Uncharacterized protein n=1 Tax=Neisseria macacae ATCC 33926 TaxID=997348 RepID=A0AA36XKF1_9NEIS|nr:hypothetical protein HMPREF9418_2502 [Neisseria macacae ATCC 33926]